MRTPSPLPRAVLTVLGATALLGLAACSDDADEATEAKPEESDALEATEEPEGDVAAVADTPDRVLVQDLWIHEQVTALRPGRDPVDLGPAIEEALGALVDRSVELADDLTFHVVDTLRPGLLDPDGRERDDVDLTAGLLEHEGARSLAVLATPHLGAGDNVGFGDQVVLDLTVLGEDLLAPGDAVVVDHAFVQALPPHASGVEMASVTAEEAAADDLELLALGWRPSGSGSWASPTLTPARSPSGCTRATSASPWRAAPSSACPPRPGPWSTGCRKGSRAATSGWSA